MERLQKRENLEEGRKMKQKIEYERKRLDQMKVQKLSELKSLHVNPKYITDLEKFKLKYV
jgi:hypothetical protein